MMNICCEWFLCWNEALCFGEHVRYGAPVWDLNVMLKKPLLIQARCKISDTLGNAHNTIAAMLAENTIQIIKYDAKPSTVLNIPISLVSSGDMVNKLLTTPTLYFRYHDQI